MKRSRLFVLFVLAGVVVAGCSPGAADGPVANAGNPQHTTVFTGYDGLTGPDRTAKLLADAKAAGGELDLYTSNTDIQDLVDGFEKTYPGVKVNAFRANSETVLQRIEQEAGARKTANDVVDTDDTELDALSHDGVLAAYNGPAKASLRQDAVFGDWQADRFNGFVAGWNTSLVPAGQAPKRFTDLAGPQWKGKIALEVGDWEWYAAMHIYLTDVRKMPAAEVDRIFEQVVANAKVTKGHTAQGQLLSAGQFALACSIYTHTVDNAADKGAPVSWHPVVDPIILRPNGLGLMAQAPHPAAALLWADWVLGPGQQLIAKDHRIPAVQNVPGYVNPVPAGAPVYAVPGEVLRDSQSWNKSYDDLLRGVPQVG